MKQNVKKEPVRTGVTKSKGETLNASGFSAAKRTNKTALFLLGVGRFFGEKSFYEDDSQRFVDLIHKVTKKDPEWVAAFLKWLRNDANIRTAAIVGAAEYVRAGGPNGRAVVKSVIVRGDEPAEMLAYWINNYGRKIPQPIKRGVRDSATRLYTEANYAKWDSSSNAVRMADVVELTHPVPADDRQSDLFKFMIEARHGRGTFEGKRLYSLETRSMCESRDDYFRLKVHGNRTITWENVSSAGTGPMSAGEWVRLYPHMGYMAKLRNLRNLDKAGVSLKDKRAIGEWLADPENVAKSRQLPMRFYSAYRSVGDDVWNSYLSEALDHSLANVPKVKGNWLVLVDASGSMNAPYSDRSAVSYYDAATVFAAAFAKVNGADIRTYSYSLSPVYKDTHKNTLRIVRDLHTNSFWFSGGTLTGTHLKQAFAEGKYDGVILLTDEQYNYGFGYYGFGERIKPSEAIPANVPLYTFNLAGYKSGHETGINRVTVGGLSDAAFSMIAAVESARAKWPWE